MSDSEISRADGLLLIIFWALSSFVIMHFQTSASEPVRELRSATRNLITHILLALGGFVIVGFAASGLIRSIIMLSLQFGIPEYILSFFGASIGTSLPELAIEFTAIKRNQRQMALGDVFGSCLVDATLSIGIDHLLFFVS